MGLTLSLETNRKISVQYNIWSFKVHQKHQKLTHLQPELTCPSDFETSLLYTAHAKFQQWRNFLEEEGGTDWTRGPEKPAMMLMLILVILFISAHKETKWSKKEIELNCIIEFYYFFSSNMFVLASFCQFS